MSWDNAISLRGQANARPAPSAGPAEDLLLSVVDWGLAAVVLAVPWLMGGRHPLGELVLVILAVLVALAWGTRQCLLEGGPRWTGSPATIVLAAAVGLVLLQLAPLPHSMLSVLSPSISGSLPLWQPNPEISLGLGSWSQVSVNPQATASSLVMLLSYGLIVLVATQRITRIDDVESILRRLALSVSLLAGVALVQYLAGNGKFLWIYEHPYRDTTDAVKGPFTNKNHFAHLLALGLGPLLWFVHRGMCRSRKMDGLSGTPSAGSRSATPVMLPLVALGLVLFAGLMTLSRGGAMAMLTAGLVSVASLAYAGLLSKKLVAGLVGAMALIAAALAIHGYQHVATRLGDFVSGSVDSLDKFGQRRALWMADARACQDFYPLGAGIGSHRDVYPMYFSEPLDVELTHAENGPLQIALEAGAPGVVLLGAAIVLCGTWCVGTLRRASSERAYLCAAAVSASLAASLVHSIVDFVWYIPSLAAITALMGACSLRLWQLNRATLLGLKPSGLAVSRASCAAATAAVALVGAWMIGDRFCATLAALHWDAYLRYALARDPATDKPAVPNDSVFESLQQVLHWTPGDARAHLRLAQICLRRFDQLQETSNNAIPLSQIRDAAVQSRFASKAALDAWLARAVGQPRGYLDSALLHTRRALVLCPLLGEAYVNLGDLCFLEGAPAAAKPACIAQALRVRPHSGEVLLAAGSDAALAGNLEQAVEHWRGALDQSRMVQVTLSDLLVAYRIPPEFVIEHFRPKLPVLRLLAARYAAAGIPPQHLRPFNEYFAQVCRQEALASSGAYAAARWLELHGVCKQMNRPQETFECLRRALDLNPNDYDTRYTLGVSLFQAEYFDDAENHLSWCLYRRPHEKHLQDMLAGIVKERIARSGTPTAATRSAPR